MIYTKGKVAYNFTLFKKTPEFNALYQLLNVKTKTLYSEKFSIHVIDLSRIDLATEEDRHYGIDRWAKLFKTKTWEDLRMITKNNETMQKFESYLTPKSFTISIEKIRSNPFYTVDI